MTELFTSLLNMSITASCVAVAIIVIRMPMRKVPKVFLYALWLPLWIRLVIPFSFSSRFSFLNLLKPFFQDDAGGTKTQLFLGSIQKNTVNSGVNTIDNAIPSTHLVAPVSGIDPGQTALVAASIIWISGIVLLLGYSIISYLRILNNVRTSTRLIGEVFETDRIMSPFVLGFIKPKIFIPVRLSANELPYVLAHERTHIRRKDYIIKPLAFLTVIIHWFNPLIWLAFAMMSQDMEMSCDESVLKKFGADMKGCYAKSLLSFSAKRSRLLAGSPLAFGESSVKSRIKNILSYKKPAIWVIAATIITLTVFMIVFTANPNSKGPSPAVSHSGYDVEALLAGKTPYVGNNSKVVRLVDLMPLPEGIVRDIIELQTKDKPYGLTIHLKMKDSSAMIKDGALSGDEFYRNAIILFSLIDNVDIIHYKILDDTGKHDGASYTFTYTRDMVEKLTGGNVRSYASGAGKLKALIDRVKNMSFNTAITDRNNEIEKYLDIITTPSGSSNPYDYIKAHRKEYESIMKMGDEALKYLLAQFEKGGNNNDLRGYIMMALCKDLLGDRNNVTEEGLLPQEWFEKLSAVVEIKLPDFKGKFTDKIEQLVYDAAVNKYSRADDGFTIVAPTILGTYEDPKINKLVVVATVYSNRYRLYGKTLSEVGGSVIPAAITFVRNADNTYTLKEYSEAMDGSYFSTSIKEFVKALRSEKLYNRIMEDYGNNKKRIELLNKNLVKHLKANNQKGVNLKLADGELVPLT